MSGGSFGNLAFHLEYDLIEGSIFYELSEMIKFLQSEGKTEPAKRLQSFLDKLSGELIDEGLLKVIHDAEWWNDCDISEEDFDATWEEYSKRSRNEL